MSPAATAAIASSFLRDLIEAGHLFPEMTYLTCDPSKIVRARKSSMEDSKEKDREKYRVEKIVGLGYDGRRDKHTWAIVLESARKIENESDLRRT